MKPIKIEIISDSESEDESYLKIFYPNSSKFIEVPLDNGNGKLWLKDIQLMEPNFVALNLIKPNSEGGKLYKPKNGCFKEPKEKWNSFNVFGVLQSPVNAMNANSSVSDTCSNINSDINQLQPTFLNSTETKRKKKRVTQSPPSPSIQSTNDSENMDPNEYTPSCDNAEISNFELCEAYNVSNIYELKKLLCDGNQVFKECFTHYIRLWRKSILSYANVHIVKALFYAFYSNILLRTLDSTVSEYCQICDKKFTLRHLVEKKHVIKYQSIYNDDPPEISIILNPDNFTHFIPTDALCKMNTEKELYCNYFTNVWYAEKLFDRYKSIIIHRIKEAQLYFSFKDPSFIEKLLFLRKSFMRHPKLKEIFSKLSYCKNCSKDLQNLNNIMTHIFSKEHITLSLTQYELDKLVHAVSYINYSNVDGFYYVDPSTVTKNRKRIHPQEEATTTSETISKRQRKI